MAPGITLDQKQQAELKEAFIIYDSDGDGKVTREQATQIIRSIAISPTNEELNGMLGERDRHFSLNELQQVIQSKAPPMESRDSLLDAFRIFDKHGNGFIDAKELRHVLVHLGEKLKDEEVDELMREVEINIDNQISYEEMVMTLNV